MASEIRVNKINSQTGVGTITLSPTGVDISGITTAATLKATTGIVTTLTATTGIVTTLTTNTTRATTGIVTTLTATTGIVTTLTTNTLTANNTAKVGSGVTLSPDGDVFVTGVTTSSTVNVGAAVTISESGIEASGIGITCANINGTQIGGRRNIVINGAMNVAQRGTSSTSVGYQTVDRIYQAIANTDESPTITQADISSSDAPYLLGFRKSYKVQNGNQTGGAGAADEIATTYNVEAQDLAQSGWDYTSSSSNITLSFWVKSSVAQQFQVNMRIYPDSGDQKEFCFEYTLSANTWTKVIKTIPGASGNVLRNTNELGMFIQFPQFYGSNYTANTRAFDTWETKNNAQNYKDYATDWYTTNDATWEITGLQLEVGSQATPFEHRSFGEEIRLCHRYYQQYPESTGDGYGLVFNAYNPYTTIAQGALTFPEMRSSPSVTTSGNFRVLERSSARTVTGFNFYHASKTSLNPQATTSSLTIGEGSAVGADNDSTARIKLSSEL